MADAMTRRDLMKAAAAGTLAMSGLGLAPAAAAEETRTMAAEPFKLKYAPHFGMFQDSAGGDLVDQLKFAHDAGFRAWEDNGMMGRSVADQERVAREMTRLGMTMGVFVADAEWGRPVYALGGEETRANLKKKAEAAVEVAKRVNAKWMTVVPGPYDL
ncbi:MAG: hypothetical protein MH204_03505, partial [Fimbriimonadaceae bacterium]|nr:hypothetical protein [Fimbriimonadaceae bacterium]